MVSGLACGRAGVWGADVCRAAVCAFMVFPVALVVCDRRKVWRRSCGLNSAFLTWAGGEKVKQASPLTTLQLRVVIERILSI
jgi:hypothetical protein